MWELGRDEVDRFGRPSGSGKGPSDLWVGTIILGLGTVIMEDGQECTRLETGRQVGVAAFCI